MSSPYGFPLLDEVADLADDFNRANESFPTAVWADGDAAFGAYGGGEFGVRSFEMGAVVGTGTWNGSYPSTVYLERTVTGPAAATMRLPDGLVPLVVAGIGVFTVTGSSHDGYYIEAGDDTDTIEVQRRDNGVATVLSSVAITPSAVYGLGIRVIGNRVEAWIQSQGGSWTLATSTSDDDYAQPTSVWSLVIYSDAGPFASPYTGGIDDVVFGAVSTGFPGSPVYDRFMRPDNATNMGTVLWQASDPYGSGISRLGLSSQQAYSISGDGSDVSTATVSGPVEAWAEVAIHSGSHELNVLSATGASYSGYAVKILTGGNVMRLARYSSASQTDLTDATLPATFASGDQYGIRVHDGWVEGYWRDDSAGSPWRLVAVAQDTTHGGPWRFAGYLDNATARLGRVGFGKSQPGRVFPTVLVDWGGGDALVIGSGTIGTGELAGFLALQPSFVHEHSDVTSYVTEISVQRGRADTNTPSYAGRADIALNDPEGAFIPGVGSSVLNVAVDVMQGVRVIATHQGDDYNLFTGFTTRARQAYRPSAQRTGRTTFLSCEDASTYLSSAKVGDAFGSGSVAYSGYDAHELVELWLSQVNVPWRNVGTVSNTTGLGWVGYENTSALGAPDPSAPTALSLIQDLLVADQGAFFIDAGGTAVYQRRELRYPGTAAGYVGTISDVMGGMEPTVDLANLATRVIINSSGTAYTVNEAVTYPYSGPTDRYGYRDLSVSSQFIKDASHFNELGEFLLQVNTAYGGTRQVALPIERDAEQTALALSLELNDHVWVEVTVTRPTVVEGLPGGGSKFVDGIEHSWRAGEPLRTSLTLGYDNGSSLDNVS